MREKRKPKVTEEPLFLTEGLRRTLNKGPNAEIYRKTQDVVNLVNDVGAQLGIKVKITRGEIPVYAVREKFKRTIRRGEGYNLAEQLEMVEAPIRRHSHWRNEALKRLNMPADISEEMIDRWIEQSKQALSIP